MIGQDFPDPGVLLTGAHSGYAFATNTGTTNVQVAHSSDLTHWVVSLDDALPQLPSWALSGYTWAPAVIRVGHGRYVMYFVARSLATGKQCIGVATATRAAGPYKSPGAEPLVCPAVEGGAIDPGAFKDVDGKRYLIWKNDGNCCGLDTWLQLQPVDSTGMTLTGPPVKLIKQTQAWEGSLIEAPTLVRHDNSYVLFYSANDYSGKSYAVGYATAPALTGPYTKHDQALLTSNSLGERFIGPGGQDVVQLADGTWRMFLHSWNPLFSYRGMSMITLDWEDGAPIPALH